MFVVVCCCHSRQNKPKNVNERSFGQAYKQRTVPGSVPVPATEVNKITLLLNSRESLTMMMNDPSHHGLLPGKVDASIHTDSSDNKNNNNNNHATMTTTSSRSVLLSMELADATASSSQSGIPLSTERLHRLYGTSLIASACDLLRLGASTYATACTMFHRFYLRASLTQFDVWSVAMACTLLASKVEEEPCPVRSIIVIYAHLYRKRRLNDQDKNDTTATTTTMSLTKRQQLRQVPPMSNMSPVWHEWHKALMDTEHHILRHLGFVLYWIPGSHPHKFILYFCRALELDKIPEVCVMLNSLLYNTMYGSTPSYDYMFPISWHNVLGIIATIAVVWIFAFDLNPN